MVLLAWLAAGLVFLSFFMKTIVPLRTMALFSNLAFIGYGLLGLRYGIFDKVLPILVLHCALLPLNWIRLHEVKSKIKAIRAMRSDDGAAALLTPYMQAERRAAGSVLFRQGDRAGRVYVVRTGQVRLLEFDRCLGAGALFGEVAVFSDDATRTATAVCDTDCELYSVAGEKILELFYQDQAFAFLIARRLARYA